MTFNPHVAIVLTWETLGIFWLIGMAFTKHNVRAQAMGPRLVSIALGFVAYALVLAPWFDRGWLGQRFVPAFPGVSNAGFLITLAGALFAVWARLTIGANWSGRPSVKAGHELVVNGPYALARHPIYTGLLLATGGTALAVGQWHALFGFALLVAVFAGKIREEEGFMMQTFPDSYPDYRKRVKALIPGIL
jgi:protein-S-isoprenylcysteine O-methyltransferase Ste14